MKSWHFFRLTNVTRRKGTISAGRCFPSSSPNCLRPAYRNYYLSECGGVKFSVVKMILCA